MRHTLLLFTVLLANMSALAQERGDLEAKDSPGKDGRDAFIRSTLTEPHGEVTAMEPLNDEGGGVIIGYRSGALLNCFGNEECREFQPTPNKPVRRIAVSKRGKSEIVWVAYPHGIIYQCINYICREFR